MSETRARAIFWAWGNNADGQLGDGTRESRSTPARVDLPTDLVRLEVGTNVTYGLRADGTVLAWGRNDDGKIGDGTTAPTTVPVAVKGLRDVTALAASAAGSFTLALKADGTVWGWGDNLVHQLANGTDVPSPVPVRVGDFHDAKFIAAGVATGYAVRSDGTVWAWGDNRYGQCGPLGEGVVCRTPVEVCSSSGVGPVIGNSLGGEPLPPFITVGDRTVSSDVFLYRSLGDITAICAGVWAGYALASDGTVWAWGGNALGQLGNGRVVSDLELAMGQVTRHDEPGKVRGLTDVTAIASKSNTGYALRIDGTVWAWGANRHGALGIDRNLEEWVDYGFSPRDASQLATQDLAASPHPLRVAGLEDVRAIDANGESSYALREDGTVWAWGDNSFGDLGDGTMQPRARPVQVANLREVDAIAAGITSAFAVVYANDAGASTDDADASAYEPTQASTGAEKGGCYIATAVYGSYEAEPVMTLRRFRDERLSESRAGRSFIRIYYALSPRLARRFHHGTLASRAGKRVLDTLVRKLESAPGI